MGEAGNTLSHVRNIVVVSDIHAGCQMALCPPAGIRLDGGGIYIPSEVVSRLWAHWTAFWDNWVPLVCHNEPFCVVVNGDAMDGVHHKSTTQISHNLADQQRLAYEILAPVVEKCDGRFYMVRGTEAHAGQAAENEEKLAERLGAIPDDAGNRSRFELWMRVRDEGNSRSGLVWVMHHIGTTGSSHYESTALMKELTEAYAEAGRWRQEPPDVVVRSHRHRHMEVRVPTSLGYGISFTTAAWQLKTPFVYRTPGGRVTSPQIGGSVIRFGNEDLYTRHKTMELGRSREVEI